MTTSVKILMKEKISVDLALRDAAREFFDFIEDLPQEEIILDFKDILSISRSFAHEYMTRKKTCKKQIKEINIPINIKKMFEVVENPREKQPIFDKETIETVSL